MYDHNNTGEWSPSIVANEKALDIEMVTTKKSLSLHVLSFPFYEYLGNSALINLKHICHPYVLQAILGENHLAIRCACSIYCILFLEMLKRHVSHPTTAPGSVVIFSRVIFVKSHRVILAHTIAPQ